MDKVSKKKFTKKVEDELPFCVFVKSENPQYTYDEMLNIIITSDIEQIQKINS